MIVGFALGFLFLYVVLLTGLVNYTRNDCKNRLLAQEKIVAILLIGLDGKIDEKVKEQLKGLMN